MAVLSPRADFRALAPVPDEWPNAREHRTLLARAIRQLQGLIRRHPVEVVSTATDYTMVDVDSLILVDATVGNRTVTLLTAAGRKGRRVIVKKTDSSANLVIIDPAGAETIDGSSTISLTQLNAARGMMSDGTNWRLISAIGNATAL